MCKERGGEWRFDGRSFEWEAVDMVEDLEWSNDGIDGEIHRSLKYQLCIVYAPKSLEEEGERTRKLRSPESFCTLQTRDLQVLGLAQ